MSGSGTGTPASAPTGQGLTFGDLVQELEDRLGFTGQATLLKRLVNKGKDRLVSAAKWPFLETGSVLAFANGTTEYSLPQDAQTVVAIYNSSDELLAELHRDTFDEAYRSDTSTGEPSVYVTQGMSQSAYPQIRVWPTPDASYSGTVRYLRRVPNMVLDADIPEHIPPEYHYAIADAAEMEYYSWEGDANMTQIADNRFKNDLINIARTEGMDVLAEKPEGE